MSPGKNEDGSHKKWNSKGYLCYKTIIPQNVLSVAQVKNFFILWKIYVLFSRYSGFWVSSYATI